MTAIDRQILELCRDEFRPLKPLIGPIPSATIYRHARGLLAVGWLRKERGMYGTTDTGLRQLAEAASGRQWDRLTRLYPPLRFVPTAAHGAMAELILAAVAARQHETRPDRHAAFVAFGGTLRWKSSLGVFGCLALGLDPARHLVDCGAEAGKSLSVRRTGTGVPVFKRELLDAPFLVLDEFLTAEPAVRATLGVFLSGRLVVPFENQQLVVRPVPLLTLNPRSKDTLEARLGLSAAQIRRAILANFDAVPMPDLAMIGERALTAARTEGPLVVGAPTVDCKAYHRAIVNLTRGILLPIGHDRVDVEVVINLCTGMSAFVPEPAEAIAQIGHGLGLLAETMNWAQPGWLESVARFGLEASPSVGARTASTQAIALRASDDTSGASEDPPAVRAHVPTASRSARHELPHPNLSLSDALRMRLIWLAVDTRRPLEQALTVLVDAYLLWRQQKVTFATLLAILRLAEQFGIAQIEVETVYEYVKAGAELAKHNCTFEDVPEALRVLDLLGELPEAWTWSQAHDAMRGVARILSAGISADQLNEFLQRHQQLFALGFDEATAEAIARAVGETGAMQERRDAVLRAMAAGADRCVDVAEFERELERLRAEGAALQAERERLRRLVKALTTRVHTLAQLEVAAQRRRAAIDAEAAATSSELGALRAFRALVQRKPGAVEIFCADLERLDRWLRSGGRPDDAQTAQLMTTWVQTLCTYLSELVAETRATQPAR